MAKITVSWQPFAPELKVHSQDLKITRNGTETIVPLNGTVSSHVIENAQTGVYSFAVRGSNIVGAGPFSQAVAITQAPPQPPPPEVLVEL